MIEGRPVLRNLDEGGFHYNQVGSVLSESDKDGQLVAMHYQDAFGVRLNGWGQALPGGVREGWAHNTKELDPGTGLVYMYQRHYVPEYGMFMSRAPYEPLDEHPYVFANSEVTQRIDADGRISVPPIDGRDMEDNDPDNYNPAAEERDMFRICASRLREAPFSKGSGCGDFAGRMCGSTNGDGALLQCVRTLLGHRPRHCKVYWRTYWGGLHSDCLIKCDDGKDCRYHKVWPSFSMWSCGGDGKYGPPDKGGY